MLSNKNIVCPNNLINVAKKVGTVDAAIVNAGEIFPMESVHKAVQHNLINPIFIGNENEIKKYVQKILTNKKKELEELKNELSMIVVTQTATGRERWDTPEVKPGAGRKSRLRKDRYSSL